MKNWVHIGSHFWSRWTLAGKGQMPPQNVLRRYQSSRWKHSGRNYVQLLHCKAAQMCQYQKYAERGVYNPHCNQH